MSEQDFFKSALADFTFEAASGGSIRHLADFGYTVKQITEQLSFPTPYERVQKAVRERMLETGVLLLEEPGSGKEKQTVAYVVDHDKYGRTSFRREKVQENSSNKVFYKEKVFDEKRNGSPALYLAEKCMENGEDKSYVFCDFGLRMRREPALFEEAVQVLDERQRDYIYGLFKGMGGCYHRLNRRMREIAAKLYETKEFDIVCYFIKTEEKIIF